MTFLVDLFQITNRHHHTKGGEQKNEDEFRQFVYDVNKLNREED